jgi:hypothetical protein
MLIFGGLYIRCNECNENYKVIFLKNTGSHLFDEAYFIMSREGESAAIEQSDMVFEANRIIRESLKDRESRLGRDRVREKGIFLIPFLLGALVASAVTVIAYSAIILIV